MKKTFQFVAAVVLLAIIAIGVKKGISVLQYPWNMLPVIFAIGTAVLFGLFFIAIIRVNKPGGPYFKGQIPEQCGHYYPDVILLGEILLAEGKKGKEKLRILHCVFCGKYSIPSNSDCPNLKLNQIPSNEWREQKRQAFRKINE